MKFIKKMAIYFVGTVLGKIIVFLLVPIYTHAFAPSDYGMSDLAYTTVVMVVSIAFMELWTALLRFSFDEKEENGKYRLFTNVAVSAAILSPLYIAACVVVGVWQQLPYLPLTVVCGLCLLLLHLFQYALRGIGKSRDFVISGSISSVLQLAAVLIGVYLFKCGSEIILLAPAIGSLAAIIYIELRFRFISHLSAKYIGREKIKALVRYSFPLAINAIAYNAMTNLSRYIARDFLGEEANGYIALAAKFVLIVTSLVYIYSLAWQESAYEKSGSSERGSYYSSMFSIFVRGMGAFTGLFILATDILFPFFIAKEYFPTREILPLYYISTFLYALSTFFGHIFNAEKKTSVLLYSTLAGAVVNVGFLYLTIERIGVSAVPISLALGYAVNLILRRVFIGKSVSIKLRPADILLPSLYIALCAASVLAGFPVYVKAALVLLCPIYLAIVYREKLLSLVGKLKKRDK